MPARTGLAGPALARTALARAALAEGEADPVGGAGVQRVEAVGLVDGERAGQQSALLVGAVAGDGGVDDRFTVEAGQVRLDGEQLLLVPAQPVRAERGPVAGNRPTVVHGGRVQGRQDGGEPAGVLGLGVEPGTGVDGERVVAEHMEAGDAEQPGLIVAPGVLAVATAAGGRRRTGGGR